MTGTRSARQLVLPIRVGIDPMEKLLVANFKDDPDWQSGVYVDRNTFAVGKGTGDFAETIIEPARFEITQRSLDMHVAFTDAQERKVELRALCSKSCHSCAESSHEQAIDDRDASARKCRG